MPTIDLRSDTLTTPTPEMRQAMAQADVGDDVYGEDSTVNRLEAMSADLMKKEAGLFVPSGTMGNLVSVLTHCRRGDEMILGDRSHIFLFEGGGAAALGGVHPHTVPNRADGTLDLADMEAAIRGDNVHFPRTRLVCLENTHNQCLGAALTADYIARVAEIARRHGLKLHVDGARIFNAAAALNVAASELAAPADSVQFCLSKSLSAPVGSLVCGTRAFVREARRIRKQVGGGMRQAGILAAAGIIAIENMVDRLVEDHRRAQRLADGLRGVSGLIVETADPITNMVYLRPDAQASFDTKALIDALAKAGIKVGASGAGRIRMVTHRHIDDAAVDRVVEIIRALQYPH